MITYTITKAIMIMLLLYIHYQLTNTLVQGLSSCKYQIVNIDHVITCNINLDFRCTCQLKTLSHHLQLATNTCKYLKST